MSEVNFQKVFTRNISAAKVTTAKAEDKLLEDAQYVPPPGHISFLKGNFRDGECGRASMVSLGGVRMQDSRTWKNASEIFSRNFSWASGAFLVGDLDRLKSFQVTTTKARTSHGSVTAPLFGATFVDLEPKESKDFHLLVAFGEDVERFCSNSYIFEVKGSIGDKIEADVTKWLPEKLVFREFEKPRGWPDGSEFVQKGVVPTARSGAQIGILGNPDKDNPSFTILCPGGVCKPTPGPTRILPEDSNLFLLKYPEMIWTKLPSQEMLLRSHHSMHISERTAYIIGGYSWKDSKAKKPFPITEVTRITFTDDFQIQLIDVIQLQVPSIPASCAGLNKTLYLFGGIAFPDYDQEKENLHCFLPPETPRNKVPDPSPQLLKINFSEESLSVFSGSADAGSHSGSLQIMNTLEPLLIMTCDPHLYIYRPI